jgi:hypothetical protein
LGYRAHRLENVRSLWDNEVMSENELLTAQQEVLAAMAGLRAAEQCASGQELIDTMMFHRPCNVNHSCILVL